MWPLRGQGSSLKIGSGMTISIFLFCLCAKLFIIIFCALLGITNGPIAVSVVTLATVNAIALQESMFSGSRNFSGIGDAFCFGT